MPELPEVESFRRQAMRAVGNKRVVDVTLMGDNIVFSDVHASEFRKALLNTVVTGSGRKGKHLWLEFDQGQISLLFHFGMSGSFHVYRQKDERPSYWKIELLVDDGVRLGLRMPRRLGRVRLRKDPRAEPPISALGFDPHEAMLDKLAFRDQIRRRKRPIKALLLDQKFVAGIGNWIADEVCFQAGIHPAQGASSLNDDEIERIRKKIASVLKKAVDVEADANRFPKSWLFHSRWGKVEGATSSNGDPLAFTEVGGRTTAFVPRVQGASPRP